MEKHSIMCDSAASPMMYAGGTKHITIKRPRKTETQSADVKGMSSLSPEKSEIAESHEKMIQQMEEGYACQDNNNK